jgi:class 3 adenylate cyclase
MSVLATEEAEIYPYGNKDKDGVEDKRSNSFESFENPKLLLFCQQARAYASYFWRHKDIFYKSLATYIIMLSIVVTMLFAIGHRYSEKDKAFARTAVVEVVQYHSFIELAALASKLEVLGTSLLPYSNCTDIVSMFPYYADAILSGSKQHDNPVRYYFDAAGKVSSVYPHIDFDGLYYSNHSFFENHDTNYIRAVNRRDVTMGRPFLHGDRYLAAYMYYPMWVSASHASADLGCDSYYNCTEACYDSDANIKFVGMIRALISLNDVVMNANKLLIDDYDFCIYARYEYADDGEGQRHFCSPNHPHKPVTGKFNLFGLTFVVALTKNRRLAVEFNDPWAPAWKYRLMILGMIALVPFTIILYWTLASRENYARLLSSILPRRVIDHLGLHTGVFSEEFSDITILFSDISNFIPLCAYLTSIQIVGMLDELYSLYDALVLKHGVYKVETIGDAYMVSCGCPDKVDPKIAAIRMVAMAKDMIQTAANFRPSYLPKRIPFHIRVGINSGGVVAGVVGKMNPRYCLFGDVVNTASRMQSTCSPMRIHISYSTYKLIEQQTDIIVTPRGLIEVKGKGSMKTFYVDCPTDAFETVDLSAGETSVPLTIRRNVAFFFKNPTAGESNADDQDPPVSLMNRMRASLSIDSNN